MKVWKRAMKPVKGLTLCAKRINQYCDQDRDRKVSIAEWTVCLDVASGKFSPIQLKSFIISVIQILTQK